MSNKRLIDGEKLSEWLKTEIIVSSQQWSNAYNHLLNILGYGLFDIPNQGEAARQEGIRKVRVLWVETTDPTLKTMIKLAVNAIGITIPGITDGGEQDE